VPTTAEFGLQVSAEMADDAGGGCVAVNDRVADWELVSSEAVKTTL
jgi:hypothetical protein